MESTFTTNDSNRFIWFLLLAGILHGLILLKLNIYPDIQQHQPKVTATLLLPQEPLPPEEEVLDQNQASVESIILVKELPKKTFPTLLPYIKKRTISAASHNKQDAKYLQRWQSYVEQFGNAHYPEQVLKNNVSGNLRLLVAVKKDGSLHQVSVRKSSGSALLDQAAIKIVQAAAPFEPLPANMSQDTEILEIIRTWQFKGNLLATQ